MYQLVIVILKSPIKSTEKEELEGECVQNIKPDEVNKNSNDILAGELKDKDLNEAYDELLI
jgi:hypothetical protein